MNILKNRKIENAYRKICESAHMSIDLKRSAVSKIVDEYEEELKELNLELKGLLTRDEINGREYLRRLDMAIDELVEDFFTKYTDYVTMFWCGARKGDMVDKNLAKNMISNAINRIYGGDKIEAIDRLTDYASIKQLCRNVPGLSVENEKEGGYC